MNKLFEKDRGVSFTIKILKIFGRKRRLAGVGGPSRYLDQATKWIRKKKWGSGKISKMFGRKRRLAGAEQPIQV